MKISKILPILLIMPGAAFAANRADSAVRVGMNRGSQADARMTITVADVAAAQAAMPQVSSSTANASVVTNTSNTTDAVNNLPVSVADVNCRAAYRDCMDQFCLLDESQGERCACSDNIEYAKGKINTILSIQAEADKLYTEGVEREKLGAKANLVFADNTKNTRVSTADFMTWLTGGESDEEYEDGDVGEDVVLGDELYKMAAGFCQKQLEACGDDAEMESMLYSRMIVQDCKNYDTYLADQKLNAESNKRIAESAVRQARLEMLDTTNKYNRGECLLAYRSCISDKGGCGADFENCLDASLLKRRANACENILDQCMAVRDYVVQDWNAESKTILAQAEKNAQLNAGAICKAKTWNCLEETCAVSLDTSAGDSMCLKDINVATSFCPIISECESKVPGFRDTIADKLSTYQITFCENDIDKCLQDKCGVNYTKPECVGKKTYEIASLCPQSMFASCQGVAQYNIIVQAAMLQMDYQMMQGCANYFGERLGQICGTDMSCLPIVASAESFDAVPKTQQEKNELDEKIIADSDAAVDAFFQQFEQDKTVAACADSQSGDVSKKVKGKDSLGTSVFNSAKLFARISAQRRNLRAKDARIAELSRAEDLDTARQNCLNTYKPEKPDESKTSYSYIRSVAFEPATRNCRVCRMQQVCEEGGESKAAAALKAGAGGLSGGAATGTMINAGWGTAIGGLIGAVGAGVLGAVSGGKQQFCQEIESCEDMNF